LFVVYSEILWLGLAVLVLTGGAVVGLLARASQTDSEPSEPIELTTEQRQLLLQEKHASITKAFESRKAAKKAVKARNREIATSRREDTTTDTMA